MHPSDEQPSTGVRGPEADADRAPDGVLLELWANERFAIHEPGTAWIVREGTLDLFAQARDGDDLVGALTPLFRVGVNEAVFGVADARELSAAAHPAHGDLGAHGTPDTNGGGRTTTEAGAGRAARIVAGNGAHAGANAAADTADGASSGAAGDLRAVGLIACPSGGAKVLRTTVAALQARLDADPGDADVARWLEGWLGALARIACGDVMPPADLITLKADQTLSMEDGPRAVAPRDGVLWVRDAGGSSRVLARPELATNGGFVPVSLHGWLQAGAGPLQAVSTRGWHALDPEWSALQPFHQLMLACLARERAARETREGERLEAKARASASTLQAGMWRLAKSLRGGDEAPAAEAAADGDPLLEACRAVGDAMGIRLVRPAGWTRDTPSKEPVEAIARASGVRVRRVVLRDGWWTREGGPLLAFREHDAGPVALLQPAAQRYTLRDPEDQSTRRVDRRVAATLSGIAYTFYRPFPSKAINFLDLLKFGLAGSRRDLIIVAAMGFAGGLLSLAAPAAMGIVFDTAIPGAQRGQVIALAAFLAVAGLAGALFTLTRNFATLRLQGRLDATLQAAAWDRLLRLPVPFFRDYSSGDLAVRSLAFNEIRQVLAGPALSLLITQLFSGLSVGLLFVYSTRLAVIALLLIAASLAISGTALYLYVQYARQVAAVRGRISGLTAELVQGVAKFRMAGAEGRALAVWARETGERKHLMMRAAAVERGLAVFEASWPLVCSAVIFYAASTLMQGGSATLTTGSFLAFLTIFTQLITASLQFAHMLFPVLALLPVYERARPILTALPEADSANAPPGELTGALEVSHLTFRYAADGPLILRDVTFRILPGEMVAIVGASGCGKSTLFRLLLGFETPESGSVYYDRQDLAGLDVQAVRRQVGVVLQNGRFGTGTLRNMILGSTGRTGDDAWEAARMTGLDKDIQAMPMGIHTVVSDDGGTLSGGQRQRLMIARAIVNRPRILFFDEATSALDNETQAIVTRSLESLQATRIVIAHRLSTILNADRILMLDKGCVVQAGTYQELMAQDGPFRQLASRQVA